MVGVDGHCYWMLKLQDLSGHGKLIVQGLKGYGRGRVPKILRTLFPTPLHHPFPPKCNQKSTFDKWRPKRCCCRIQRDKFTTVPSLCGCLRNPCHPGVRKRGKSNPHSPIK